MKMYVPATGLGQRWRTDCIARRRGQGEQLVGDHPMLTPSGEFIDERELLHNDIFRIVHDVFGHGL